jgi:simple sugar transport system ATP-binding protein
LTENLALGVHDAPAFRRGPLLLWPRLRARARDLIREYDVRATGPSIATRALSGGNQQKVVIARALSGRPRVIVAVNPTRGLDVNASAFVHRTLRRAAEAEGAAVVLVSTELDEVLALASDRVAVLYAGRVLGNRFPERPAGADRPADGRRRGRKHGGAAAAPAPDGKERRWRLTAGRPVIRPARRRRGRSTRGRSSRAWTTRAARCGSA